MKPWRVIRADLWFFAQLLADISSLILLGWACGLWIAIAEFTAAFLLGVWLFARAPKIGKVDNTKPLTEEQVDFAVGFQILLLLMWPGLLSDVWALVLLLPPVRRGVVRRRLARNHAMHESMQRWAWR